MPLSVEGRQGNCLYIVSTNSFNGCTRKSGGEYLSTKRNGEGTGLFSISSVAKKYQGYTRISHNEKEFNTKCVRGERSSPLLGGQFFQLPGQDFTLLVRENRHGQNIHG